MSAGRAARQQARRNELTGPTSGLAPGHLQANLIVLPSRYADDFRTLCARNPVPCPLIAESSSPGSFRQVRSHVPGLTGAEILGHDGDLRTDVPSYMVYRDSKLVTSHCSDVTDEWTQDHTAFLIGCSYSFEAELTAEGLKPRHIALGRNVPMYRTTMPLCASGVFVGGTCVVSMRPYKASEVERVREITRKYRATHGEPIAWGWSAVRELGIQDINKPEWGEAPLRSDGQALRVGDEEEVPVFWGCGVTPQEAVMRADLKGVVMAHAPGHMLVLDAQDRDIITG